jgi:L-lactate dehydrogenase
MKVAIIGNGRVGNTIAYALVMRGLARKLLLVARSIESTYGDALDLRHASCFTQPADVRSATVETALDCDVVIIAASAKLPAETSKLDRRLEAPANARLMKQIIPTLARQNPDAVFVIVTNPVDAMTQIAQELSGLPSARVLGTGTLIDTVRLRALLADRCKVHTVDIRAYVLGEHGDGQIAALSAATMGGAPIGLPEAELAALSKQARDAGTEVRKTKGFTNHAIASSVVMIVDAIASDSHSVLPVTTRLTNYLGVSDACLSAPCVIGRHGVEQTLDVRLNEEERRVFHLAADVARRVVEECRAAIAD